MTTDTLQNRHNLEAADWAHSNTVDNFEARMEEVNFDLFHFT